MAGQHSILVNIRKGQLIVLDGEGNAVAAYPVICGRNSPRGTKEAEGDERTPRGEYRICTVNGKSQFCFFYGLSYPGPGDAARGMERGALGQDDFERIMDAHRRGARPPWDTPLGGEIGIHGGGIGRDGTRGCVAMRDEDCLALRDYVGAGTPVKIEY